MLVDEEDPDEKSAMMDELDILDGSIVVPAILPGEA